MALRAEPAPANRTARSEGPSVREPGWRPGHDAGEQADPTGLPLWTGERSRRRGAQDRPHGPQRGCQCSSRGTFSEPLSAQPCPQSPLSFSEEGALASVEAREPRALPASRAAIWACPLLPCPPRAWPPTGLVTLGRPLLSLPQFPCLESGIIIALAVGPTSKRHKAP